MPVVLVQEMVAAPIERVFDLCRSVEVHIQSTPPTQEQAVGGVRTGLLELNDCVTWEATHLGVRQRLTSRIMVCDRPFFFQDQMVAGAFQAFTHNHQFRIDAGTTVIQDRFEYESPYGPIGDFVDHLFLTEYMRQFLIKRLRIVKEIAESDTWCLYLPDQSPRASP